MVRFVTTRQRHKMAGKLRIAARTQLPTSFGTFSILGISSGRNKEAAVVLQMGRPKPTRPTLLRIHSQCLTGDVFGSQRCDCRGQLELALRRIARRGEGLLIYLPQEGRGIGLINKLMAYQLQDRGLDTVDANRKLGFAADHRDYRLPAAILKLLKVRRVELLSNNPEKVRQLEENGITVQRRIPCETKPSRTTRAYLRAKKEKLGHLISTL